MRIVSYFPMVGDPVPRPVYALLLVVHNHQAMIFGTSVLLLWLSWIFYVVGSYLGLLEESDRAPDQVENRWSNLLGGEDE